METWRAQPPILDGLPPHVALLDREGVIVAVNAGWERFAVANGLANSQFGPGRNYLELCERARGDGSGEARNAAAGIRRVLCGQAPEFVLEYACHLPNEERWFRLTATPLSENSLAGAIVMHSDITDRKLTEDRFSRQQGMLSSAVRIAGVGGWVNP